MIPSDAARIASKSSTASGFSILAMTLQFGLLAGENFLEFKYVGGGADEGERHVVKLAASIQKARSIEILVGQRRGRDLDAGEVDPLAVLEDAADLLPGSGPPRRPPASTSSSSRPSSSRIRSPGRTSRGRSLVDGRDDPVVAEQLAGGDGDRFLPTVSSISPPCMRPVRILGPCRSPRMATARRRWRDRSRMVAHHLGQPAWSPWEKLSRKTSAPASIRASSIASDSLAGPTVATILVRRNTWCSLALFSRRNRLFLKDSVR